MKIGINKLFEEAEMLMDQYRLIPALEKFQQVHELTKIPGRRALASYNIGIIQWNKMGNGVAAREEFLVLAASLDTYSYDPSTYLRKLHAGAIENAMLCALSFDEFESLAERLHSLAPQECILSGLLPVVRKSRDQGIAWSQMLFDIAYPYYNRNDPKLDAGRYGEAKSTYHLLLANRKKLHLSREDWRMALQEYCALSMRMSADCLKARGGDMDMRSPEEYLSILTSALPFVDEYLVTNSGDELITTYRDDIITILNSIRQNHAQFSLIHQQVQHERSEPRPGGCMVLMLAGFGFALWLSWIIFKTLLF